MTKRKSDIAIEYEYAPTPDGAERLEEAWDIIVGLIIEDFLVELEEGELDVIDPQCRAMLKRQWFDGNMQGVGE
ncbi:hypothetical protein HN698_07475 [Candidatus Woesearchaeota archaeon]|nr:hypothetical protein [Candidatus Woesearchaeota archaeon]